MQLLRTVSVMEGDEGGGSRECRAAAELAAALGDERSGGGGRRERYKNPQQRGGLEWHTCDWEKKPARDLGMTLG
jgi:hypothetical protein